MSGFKCLPPINTQLITITIDCCETAAVPVPQAVPNKKCVKQETKMYNDLYDTDKTPDERKAEYLDEQRSQSYWEKRGEAYTAFNMGDPKAPTSPKEFVEFIKTGKFTFPKNYLNDDGSWRDEKNPPYYYNLALTDYIIWTDPSKVKDEAGYEATVDKIETADIAVRRTIKVGTPAEGLKALQEFEATTFH